MAIGRRGGTFRSAAIARRERDAAPARLRNGARATE